jgi:hypothetical protein
MLFDDLADKYKPKEDLDHTIRIVPVFVVVM